MLFLHCLLRLLQGLLSTIWNKQNRSQFTLRPVLFIPPKILNANGIVANSVISKDRLVEFGDSALYYWRVQANNLLCRQWNPNHTDTINTLHDIHRMMSHTHSFGRCPILLQIHESVSILYPIL